MIGENAFHSYVQWKDFENRRAGVRWSVVKRSLGVVYLKARFWASS